MVPEFSVRAVLVLVIVVQMTYVFSDTASKTYPDPSKLIADSTNTLDQTEISRLLLLQDLDTEDVPDTQVRRKRYFGLGMFGLPSWRSWSPRFGGYDGFSGRYYGGGFRRRWGGFFGYPSRRYGSGWF